MDLFTNENTCNHWAVVIGPAVFIFGFIFMVFG